MPDWHDQSGQISVFRGKSGRIAAMKKQHVRAGKVIFLFEIAFFSSSIRLTSEEAVFCW